MFQNTESANQKEIESGSSAGILSPEEIYRKLIAAFECKEPRPPVDWNASKLD
jgi:hypothetical protein